MNNFKQFVMFASLAASFFSCTLQGMEKEISEEEVENLTEILALLLAEPETLPEKPSFLRKNDELSSRSAQIKEQIKTKQKEEKVKTKLEGNKINVSPKVAQQREIIAAKKAKEAIEKKRHDKKKKQSKTFVPRVDLNSIQE